MIDTERYIYELISKFGEDIVKNEKIYVHNCDEHANLVDIGTIKKCLS